MTTVRELTIKWGFDIDTRGADKLQKDIDGIKRSAIGIGKVVAAAGVGIGFILREAGKQEQVKIAFETLLGSAEAAKKKLVELYDFARRTPFTIPGIEATAKQLIGMGINADDLIPTLKALGDVSAGLSIPLQRIALNYGQIRTQGKLTGKELRDFAVAGVPLLEELAKNFGKTKDDLAEVSDMVSRSKVGFKDVEKAFISMTSKGGKFYNLMIKQSKSLLGLVSNMQDFFILFVRDLGNELLPQAKKMVLAIMHWAEANKELIKTRALKFIKGLVGILKDALFLFREILRVMRPLINAMGGYVKVLRIFFKIMLAIFTLKIAMFLGGIVLTVIKLISVTIALVKTMGLLNAALLGLKLALGGLIGIGIIAFLLILEDIFRGLVLQQDSFTKRLIDNWDKIKERFSGLIAVFRTGAFIIRSVFEVAFAPLFQAIGLFREVSRFFKSFDVLVPKFLPDIDRLVQATIGQERRGIRQPAGATRSFGTNNNNVRVNSPVTVNVPPNTPPEKVTGVVREGIENSFNTILRNAFNANTLPYEY